MQVVIIVVGTVISIHALLAESDIGQMAIQTIHNYFYPRSPCGERLHATSRASQDFYFYPRSPCGERLLGNAVAGLRMWKFLSTLSLRRATSAEREYDTEG